MTKCLYLLSVVFHVAAGCPLSGDKNQVVITRRKGGSVLLPCSCSDLHTKPQKLTWMSDRTGRLTEMLNDEHYRGRLLLFNNISPANLSLLISDLREEDQAAYRCSTESEYRDIRIYVKAGRRKTSTHPRKTDTTPPSEQPQSKTTNSPPASSSTPLEEDKQQTHSSLPLVFGIMAVLLLVIPGVVAFICWRRKGGRCGKNMTTEGCRDCKRKQENQTVPDDIYCNVTHINTARAARVQISVGETAEYANIITNPK